MSESILTSTKKILGLDEDYTAFDLDVLIHINSVFSTLQSIGIGPAEGFMIDDKDTKWSDFLANDSRLNSVKTYVYLRVRLLFDPPATSFHINALTEQYREIEWRLNAEFDRTANDQVLTQDTTVWELSGDGDSFPIAAMPGDIGYNPVTGDLYRKK